MFPEEPEVWVGRQEKDNGKKWSRILFSHGPGAGCPRGHILPEKFGEVTQPRVQVRFEPLPCYGIFLMKWR